MKYRPIAIAYLLCVLFVSTKQQALTADSDDLVAEFISFNRKTLEATRPEELPFASPANIARVPTGLRSLMLQRAKSAVLRNPKKVHIVELEGHYAKVAGAGMTWEHQKEVPTALTLTFRKVKNNWDLLNIESAPIWERRTNTNSTAESRARDRIMDNFISPQGRFHIQTFFRVQRDGTVCDIRSTSYPKSAEAESAANEAVRITRPLVGEASFFKSPNGRKLHSPVVGILDIETIRESCAEGLSDSLSFYKPGDQSGPCTTDELSERNADSHLYTDPSSSSDETLSADFSQLNHNGEYLRAVPYALEIYRRAEKGANRQALTQPLQNGLYSTICLTQELIRLKDYDNAERIAQAKLRLAEIWMPGSSNMLCLSELAEVYILGDKVNEADETVAKFITKLQEEAKGVENIKLQKFQPGSEREQLRQMLSLKYGLEEKRELSKSEPNWKRQAGNSLKVSNFLQECSKACENISVAYLKRNQDQKYEKFCHETQTIRNGIKWDFVQNNNRD